MTRNFDKRINFQGWLKEVVMLLGLIILGTAILSAVHIYNGFPLVLGDSQGYLERALDLTESSHWSNAYTVFLTTVLYVFGSAQFIAIVQNFLISTVLYIFIKNTFPKFSGAIFIGVLSLLAFTSLPWVSSMIMSDIFTPISLLCIILIMQGSLSRVESIIVSVIMFFALSAHQTHIVILPIFTVFLIVIAILAQRVDDKKKFTQHILLIMVLFFCSLLFEKNILNAPRSADNTQWSGVADNENGDVSSGYYIVAVRIWESGQLQNLLKQYCDGTHENYLCADALNTDSFMIKNVTFSNRNEYNEEYVKYATDNKDFVMYSLKKPNFYYGLAWLMARRGFRQTFNTDIRKYSPLTWKGSQSLVKTLRRINDNDRRAYRNTEQIRGVIRVMIRRAYQNVDLIWWVVLTPLTFLFLLYRVFAKQYKVDFDSKFICTLLYLLIGHVVNTVVCGVSSSNMNARYSSRTLWLVNLTVILLFAGLAMIKRKKKFDSEVS